MYDGVLEKDWQQTVVEHFEWQGWTVYHTFDSRRSNPGFPDLVCARNGELLFAELKREKGKLSPEQLVWLALIESAGIECHVWRPSQVDEVKERAARKHEDGQSARR